MEFVDVDIKKEPDPVHNKGFKIKEEIIDLTKDQQCDTQTFKSPDISKDKDNNNNNCNNNIIKIDIDDFVHETRTLTGDLVHNECFKIKEEIDLTEDQQCDTHKFDSTDISKDNDNNNNNNNNIIKIDIDDIVHETRTLTEDHVKPVLKKKKKKKKKSVAPVTAPTAANQPVHITAEASDQEQLVAHKLPVVIPVTVASSAANSSSASAVPVSTKRFVLPRNQNVWWPKQWTNLSSYNKTSSTQSRKRKAPSADDGHQQRPLSVKETAESQPDGTAQTSAPNFHEGASNKVQDTDVPMVTIHDKEKQHFAFKIKLPSKEYPWVNYPGNLIGIRGSTIKQLKYLTGCDLTILGKGCSSSGTREEQSGEDVYILVECFADTVDAFGRFARAVEILQEFIKPDANPVLLLQDMMFQPSHWFDDQYSPDWQ